MALIMLSKKNPGSLLLAWAISVAAFLTIVWHFPGHMSLDSVVQMYEGHNEVFQSFNPPLMSVFLGWSYSAFASQGGFFLINFVLFIVALLLWLRPATERPYTTPLLFLIVALFPVVLSYNGIIWKDVFFANLAILAFAILGRGSGMRYLLPALFVLTAAAQIRQQGLLALVAGLVHVLMSLWLLPASLLRRGAKMAVAILTVAISHFALKALVTANTAQEGMNPYSTGLTVLHVYDIAGVAQTPDTRFPRLEQYADLAAMREYFSGYSPERVDKLATNFVGRTPPTDSVPVAEFWPAWLEMVRSYPSAYLGHRWSVWRWQLGLEDPDKCAPIYVGISEHPATYVKSLGLHPGIGARERLYFGIQQPMVDALYRPWPYLLACVLVLVYLAWRNWREHRLAILLCSTAVAYGASYFFIGIACDVRYMYFPILAALFSLAYVAQRGRGRWMSNAQPPD